MLATDKPTDRDMMASIKIDGMRALWLPETRDQKVGWSPERSTGLWSRTGKPIQAPEFWLDTLPKEVRLDGEIYFQSYNETMSICRAHNSNERWNQVLFHVFDIPDGFYAMGLCSKPNYFFKGCTETQRNFRDVHELMLPKVDLGKYAHQLPQTLVSAAKANTFYLECIAAGHEGMMLREPGSIWTPMRTKDLIKVKPCLDSECVVVGTTEGKGKYLDMIGALIVEWKGKTFELSGMNDLERTMEWIGQTITFRYADLTPNGIPRFARFLRRRHD